MSESHISVKVETEDLADEALDRASEHGRVCYNCVP